jgi:hypothetical protein
MATTAKIGANVLWKSDGRNFDLPYGSSTQHNKLNFGTDQVAGVITALVGTVAALTLFGSTAPLTVTGVVLDAGATTPNSYSVVDLSA